MGKECKKCSTTILNAWEELRTAWLVNEWLVTTLREYKVCMRSSEKLEE